MKILLTNHHIISYSGTETFLITIAKQLEKLGHNIYIYSKYFKHDLVEDITLSGIKFSDNLDHIKSINFDIIHVHHKINAYEIRQAFPKTPIVYLSHGILPFLEQPPIWDIKISHFLAVSEEVKQNLIRQGIKSQDISIVRNPIDPTIFKSYQPINKKPKNALILSSRIDRESYETIVEALKELQIKPNFVDARKKIIPNQQIPKYINKSDIVFSLGRGILESIFCERIPIIFDYLGGDGIVLSNNYMKYAKKNFSGRTRKIKFTKSQLIKEIEKYNKDDIIKLSGLVKDNFSVQNQVNTLIKIYSKYSKDKISLDINKNNFIEEVTNSVSLTKNYSDYLHSIESSSLTKTIQNKDNDINKLQLSLSKTKTQLSNISNYLKNTKKTLSAHNQDLKRQLSYNKKMYITNRKLLKSITSSKFFISWQRMCKIKKLLWPPTTQ